MWYFKNRPFFFPQLQLEEADNNLCLTLSLPWCHFKMTNRSAEFEIVMPFFFFISMWKDFYQNA